MKKIITGLQNTMINNALNTSQGKNKTVPPPPAKRDPKANEAIYQANQAILAGVNRVVPPGSFEAPAVPRVYAPGYNPEPLSPELRMVQLNVKQPTQVIPGQVPPLPEPFTQVRRDDTEIGYGSLRPEVVATMMGLGQGASKLAEAGGFYIAPPGADDTQEDYLDKALNDAEERYNKFTTDVKTAQDAKVNVDKKIVDVLKSTDTTELQKGIADLVNQTKEITQKVTTARDFFVEKDPKSGKERFTNRGAAVVALQILSQFFGNPVQQTQLSGLITGLGSRYADEQNKLNEANFKAQLDAYNRKLQGFQAQIGVKQAEAKQKLGILQFESEAEKEKLATAKGLQRAQLDAVNSLTEKVSLEKVKAGSAEEKALVARAYKWLESGDPVFEAAARRVLQTRGYPVDILPEAGKSMKQQERQMDIDYKKAAIDALKDDKIRKDFELKLKERGIIVSEENLSRLWINDQRRYEIDLINANKPSGGGRTSAMELYFMKQNMKETIGDNQKVIDTQIPNIQKGIINFNNASSDYNTYVSIQKNKTATKQFKTDYTKLTPAQKKQVDSSVLNNPITQNFAAQRDTAEQSLVGSYALADDANGNIKFYNQNAPPGFKGNVRSLPQLPPGLASKYNFKVQTSTMPGGKTFPPPQSVIRK